MRGIIGFYRQVCVNRLSRYADEFCACHNMSKQHRLGCMLETAARVDNRQILHRCLVNGDTA